jgi:hypothetical protein
VVLKEVPVAPPLFAPVLATYDTDANAIKGKSSVMTIRIFFIMMKKEG